MEKFTFEKNQQKKEEIEFISINKNSNTILNNKSIFNLQKEQKLVI